MTLPLRAGLPPGCVTGVGSLPFLDADEAVEFVAEHCREFPFWPQLPRRSAGEGVINQGLGRLAEYLEPFDWPYCRAVRRGEEEAFSNAINASPAGLIPETASGFFALEKALRAGRFPAARAVKGHIEGPVTLAHCLFLRGHPMSRDSAWLERIVAFLTRQVAWQVDRLSVFGLPVLMVLDEPALALSGRSGPDASSITLAVQRVLNAARGRGAAVGLHCCAPLPVNLLAGLDLDLLSFDATLPMFLPGFVDLARGIIEGGGRLAFGLAPTGPSSATAEALMSRWLTLASSLGDPHDVAAQSLLTATCGLGLSTEAETRSSFTLARRTGDVIRSLAAAWASVGGL